MFCGAARGLHRAGASVAACLRASDLCGARAASLDANARSREVMTTSSVSPPLLLSLPGDTAAIYLLRQGLTIDDKRVERIWQREGLKVPHKQPKRGWLWLTDRSCIRPPEQRHTTLSRTHPRRTQVSDVQVLDEFTHECLAIRVARKLKAIACDRRSGRTPQSDTSHQHQRCSCPHSPPPLSGG